MGNLLALILALVVAEIGVQAATGRRLSSEEVLARFRSTEGGPILNPRRTISHLDDLGLRTTTGQPPTSQFRVFVFGGSTVYCGEVDDSETIPSALQARLNAAGVRARVLNFGQVIVDTSYSSAWLRSLPTDARPSAGDVVIFYVGVNDAGSSFSFTSRIDRWSAQYDNLAAPMRLLNRHSAIASQAFAWLGRGRATPNDQTDSFATALDDARRYSEGLGAHFIPILQPTLFTESMPDLYERRLATRFGTDLVAAISEIYPKVAERVVSIPGAIDARDALATVSPSPFVDWMHLDARGNGAIADLMFDAVIARVSA
jgi:lysophospholipase L1-like esterase